MPTVARKPTRRQTALLLTLDEARAVLAGLLDRWGKGATVARLARASGIPERVVELLVEAKR